MSQNDELKQACIEWLHSALTILPSKPLPLYEDAKVTFTPHGWQSEGGFIKLDYVRMIATYQHDLLHLAELDTLVNIVAKTPNLATVLFLNYTGQLIDELEQQKNLVNTLLMTFLIEYLHTMDFELVYEKLEEYIYSKEPFQAVWHIHLRNLISEVETVQLESGIVLRRATQEEKEIAVKNFLPSPQTFPDVPDIYLDIHLPIDRIGMPNQLEASNIARAVVLALRLIKAEPVGIASNRWDVPNQPFRSMKGYFTSSIIHPLAFRGEPYTLTNEDAQLLSKLLSRTKKAYNNPELATAITRFEDSYTRTKQEDKLIDYWVALEALFFALMQKEFVESMRDTIASSIAYYLANTESERRRIFAFIISSHKARSHFVHGQRGESPQQLEVVVNKTERYLRQALRKRIEELSN